MARPKKMETMFVVSVMKDKEGNPSPVALKDGYNADYPDGFFEMEITKEMAENGVPAEVPKNVFFEGKITEKLLERVVDEEDAKKRIKAHSVVVSKRQKDAGEKNERRQRILDSIMPKIVDIIDNELALLEKNGVQGNGKRSQE
jgi:hypothetical protein